MENGKTNKTETCAADSTVAWFCVLERARIDNNFELAARAKQELKRLGVIVKYKRKKGPSHDK